MKTFWSLEIGFGNTFLRNLWRCQRLDIQVCPHIFHCLVKNSIHSEFSTGYACLSPSSAAFRHCSTFNSINNSNHDSWQKRTSRCTFVTMIPDITWDCSSTQRTSSVCQGVVRIFQCLNPILWGGGQFCPTPKTFSHNFNLGKVTQKRCQIYARYLFSFLFQENKNSH